MNTRIIELAKEIKGYKAEDAELSKQVKDLNAKWNASELELMELMVEEGVKSIKLDGIGHVIMKTQNFMSVTVDHKPEFFEYLNESGNSGLLKLDVAAGTIKTFLEDHLEKLVADYKDSEGMDDMDARAKALEFLKTKGAGYFTKRSVSINKA